MVLHKKYLNRHSLALPRYRMLVALLSLVGMLAAPPSQAQIFNNPITVDTSADDLTPNGNCTLREAIQAANTNMPVDGCASGSATLADEIIFASNTDGVPIVLNLVGPGDDYNQSGDLDIRSNSSNTSNEIYIKGNGTAKTIIDGDQGDRVFEVLGTASLALESLTVRRGAGVNIGAGIYAHATSTLSLNSVVVSGNIATGPGSATGGGIEADHNFYLNNSFVIGNQAESTGSGTVRGGGLALYGGGTQNISLSMISNNIAKSSATSGGVAYGGGIFMQSTSVNIADSIVGDNQVTTASSAALGGGIHEDTGTLNLQRVELSFNTAQNSSGASANGGAISALDKMTLVNCTLADNSAGLGAGMYLYSSNTTPAVSVHGGTIALNTAYQGGGVYAVSGATLDLDNTILAANVATNSAPDCDDVSGSGHVSPNGYNLIGESDGCTFNTINPTDQVGTASNPIDPMLGALQIVAGAPTPSHVLPLLPGSPAIDAGDSQLTSAGGTCESPDQIGDTRPRDDNNDGTSACDIGAVEYVQTSSSSSGSGSTPSSSSTTSSGGGGAIGLPLLGLLLLVVVVRGQRDKDQRKS